MLFKLNWQAFSKKALVALFFLIFGKGCGIMAVSLGWFQSYRDIAGYILISAFILVWSSIILAAFDLKRSANAECLELES